MATPVVRIPARTGSFHDAWNGDASRRSDPSQIVHEIAGGDWRITRIDLVGFYWALQRTLRPLLRCNRAAQAEAVASMFLLDLVGCEERS